MGMFIFFTAITYRSSHCKDRQENYAENIMLNFELVSIMYKSTLCLGLLEGEGYVCVCVGGGGQLEVAYRNSKLEVPTEHQSVW